MSGAKLFLSSRFYCLFQSSTPTELLKITRQGISWRYTEYKRNTYYCYVNRYHRHGITMIYDRWNHSKAPPKKPPLLSYNIHVIRTDTNFLTSSPKSAPSKIKTQRNGITCMQLTSPKMPLSKTIHDQLRPLPRSSSRVVIYAFSSKQTQIPVHQSYFDLHL